MNEVKIQIPDNCELIKDGDTYIVREKKQEPPKSWEEFCKNYPKITYEYFIENTSNIAQVCNTTYPRSTKLDKNICTSKEEAEAFLALMQLRQLRKAWIGDWKLTQGQYAASIINKESDGLVIVDGYSISTRIMQFPNTQIAAEFLVCFKDLLEKAKVLL